VGSFWMPSPRRNEIGSAILSYEHTKGGCLENVGNDMEYHRFFF
jgi:hypothetical protein